VDVAHAPQASNHTTHTMGIQNPPVAMANQVHGSANNGTTVGSQNPSGMTQTSNNVPSSAPAQEWYNQGPPIQGWTEGQLPPGYPWTPGHGSMPYLQNPNYWYLYHPGPYLTQQAASLQTPSQVQQQMESPPHAARSRRERSTTPPPINDTRTKEMFVSAFCTMFAEEIGIASALSGTLSSGESTKMFSGVNQYSLCAYASCKITGDVPYIFLILDSKKHYNKSTSSGGLSE